MTDLRASCQSCRVEFVYRAKKGANTLAPSNCGQLMCRAKTTWDDAEWAHRKRFAEIRQGLGFSLNALDREAMTHG